MTKQDENTFDAVIVGAGFAGMYMLYRLRQLGMSAIVIEAGDDVGGTWYWNRYPGARCDVPTMEYSLGFSKELEQEWRWSETMSAQPEILEYANHVADIFDLRSGMHFNRRVTDAKYDEQTCRWRVSTDQGEHYHASFCIMATGCLSVPHTPEIDGQSDFAGEIYHTGRWPKEGVDLSGKRVGIIGTGSSAVQAIPVIAETAAELTIFQRTPGYTFPANNKPLGAKQEKRYKESYPEVREMQRNSPAGISNFGMQQPKSGKPAPLKSILETSHEERQAALEKSGFGVFRVYNDVYTDLQANEVACELYRDLVKQLVNDPQVAETLSPKGYPIGCKRQVFDTNFYETFNLDHVKLVDLQQSGIDIITAKALHTTQAEYGLDVLIYATGFDAMTGALNQINIEGRHAKRLKDKWQDGPRAYLGLQIHGYPNLFTITGPGSPSVLSNMLVSIEQHVEWISDCMTHMQENQYTEIEAELAAEDEWVEHVSQVGKGTMLQAPNCNSWYLGANIEGKPRVFMPYVGGVGRYRRKCEEVVANDYQGFSLLKT